MSDAPEIITFGCRLNAYESEVMRAHAAQSGLRNAVIVNTCAVTSEAERQARQAIRKARRRHPDAKIIVTGCAAQINAEAYAAMPEVDRVVGNREKMAAASFLPAAEERVAVDDIMSVRETAHHLIDGFSGRARAFVQVQNGCDHRCTFCVIPFGRGNSRSVPIGDIVAQARRLVEAGCAEIVLSGVDITSYGGDLPGRPTLGQMARRLLAQVPELPRLRISSIDAAEIDGDLERLIGGEERLMPHLHLSLQSGDDMILKRMKRRHTRNDAIELCRTARRLRPGIALGADLIAGFPTETEEMFRRSLDLVAECGLAWLHVFPYSPRPETPAARMPQIPAVERRDRAARLRAAGARAADRFLQSRIGATAQVLVEQRRRGRTEHYAPIRLTTPAVDGSLLTVRVTGRDADGLLGTAVS